MTNEAERGMDGPCLSQAYDNLGIIYGSMGLDERAIAAYEKASESPKEESYQAVAEEYDRAIRLDPRSPEAHHSLGVIYGMMDRYRDSIEELQRAIELDPNSAVIYYDLAISYKNTGMIGEAIENHEIAARLDPNMAEAHYKLGIIYEQLGERDKVIEEKAKYSRSMMMRWGR